MYNHVWKCFLVVFRLPDTVDTPSPVGLTQLQPETKLDPREEFLYGTPRTTMQGLKDATTVSIRVWFC